MFENGMHIVEEKFKNFFAGFRMLKNPTGQHMEVGVLYTGSVESSTLLEVVDKFKTTFNYTVHILHVSGRDFSMASVASDLAIMSEKWYKCESVMGSCDPVRGRKSVHEIIKKAIGEIVFSRKLDLVLSSHTADDQLEKIMLNLLRGSDIEGLAGLSYLEDWHQADKVRTFGKPFLEVRKNEILDYARYCKIKFVEVEESYDIDQSDAAYIRNNILPLVQYRFTNTGVLKTTETIRGFLKQINNPVLNVIIEEGRWLIDQFVQLPVSNRVFVIREYMKREFQIELDSKTIKGLNKVLSGDLTEVSFMLVEGTVLTRVENYLAIIQLKKVDEKA